MSVNAKIILGCLIPGLSTAIGAVPIFFSTYSSKKMMDVLLSFAAGVMLAASCFSLIIPSIEIGGGNTSAVFITALGIFIGGIIIDLIDKFVPHEHLISHREEGRNRDRLKKIWLFIVAITIHNFPEGLAVGVGFGSGDFSKGLLIAFGIALQNIPEGLAVALALISENYSKKSAFWIAALTGLVEPVGSFMGLWLISLSEAVLPFILAFAGGAMLFVISDEIIPETHSGDNERISTYGIIIGFIIMMILDVLLG